MNGDVKITLGGEELSLKCTLKAAMTVDDALGGYQEALRLVSAFKLAAFVVTVAAGLGRTPHDVKEAVYREGMPNLINPVSEYLMLLANGGRKPEKVAEAAKTGEG